MLFLSLLLLHSAAAFQWPSSASLPNGTTIPACPGQDVTLAWAYVTDDDEHLTNVEWHYRTADGGDVVMATEVVGNFFAAPSATRQLEYIPNAGVRLLGVGVQDSGVYAVHANVNKHGSVLVEEQTVTLVVSGAALTTDGQLRVSMSPNAELDNSTGEFHAVLSCGTFKPEWAARTSVVWRTPDNQTLDSTGFYGGKYQLALPNPVQDGEYTCAIDDSSPASLCVPDGSPLKEGATIKVDGSKVQFAILSARVAAQQQKQNLLEAELASQKAANGELQSQLTLVKAGEEALVRDNQALREQLQAATANTSALMASLGGVGRTAAFYAVPSAAYTLTGDTGLHALLHDVIFDRVLTNQGGCYDNKTGEFLAPVGGVYALFLTVDLDPEDADNGDLVGLVLRAEQGAGLPDLSAQAWAGLGASGSAHLLVHMPSGGKAWVTSPSSAELRARAAHGDVGSVAAEPRSSFSGVLLQAD